MRVFVFEYLSGSVPAWAAPTTGASAPQVARDAADLLHAGRAMRDAVVDGLLQAAGSGRGPAEATPIEVSCACAGPGEAEALRERGHPGLRAVWAQAGEPVPDFVRRESARHDQAWIVAPETDGLLAQLAGVVDPARWIGCSREALHLAGRKRASLARLQAHGVPTPLAFEAQATRWIVKPDDGAGCIATVRHDQRDRAAADLHARRTRGESATLEAWVEGQAMSLSLHVNAALEGGLELLGIHHQTLSMHPAGAGRMRLHDEGVALCREPLQGPRADALVALARSVVAAVPGLRGYVGVDLVWHPERGPVVIEINPRLTCAFVGLAELLGRPLAREILAASVNAQRLSPRREIALDAH